MTGVTQHNTTWLLHFALCSLSYSISSSSGPQSIRICHLLSSLLVLSIDFLIIPFHLLKDLFSILLEFLSTTVLTPFLRNSVFIYTDYLTTWPLKSLTSLHPIICFSRFIPQPLLTESLLAWITQSTSPGLAVVAVLPLPQVTKYCLMKISMLKCACFYLKPKFTSILQQFWNTLDKHGLREGKRFVSKIFIPSTSLRRWKSIFCLSSSYFNALTLTITSPVGISSPFILPCFPVYCLLMPLLPSLCNLNSTTCHLNPFSCVHIPCPSLLPLYLSGKILTPDLCQLRHTTWAARRSQRKHIIR